MGTYTARRWKEGAQGVELMPLTEAAERAGISLVTMRRRVKEHGLTIYINPRDKREKLIDWREVEALMQIRPMNQGDEELKTAA